MTNPMSTDMRDRAQSLRRYYSACLAAEQAKMDAATHNPEHQWAADRVARYTRLVAIMEGRA